MKRIGSLVIRNPGHSVNLNFRYTTILLVYVCPYGQMFLGVLQFYLLNLASQGDYRGGPPDCATQRGFPRLAA